MRSSAGSAPALNPFANRDGAQFCAKPVVPWAHRTTGRGPLGRFLAATTTALASTGVRSSRVDV